MRKILLSLTAASAIVAAASIVPASAMTVGTASGIQAAIADTSLWKTSPTSAAIATTAAAACAGGGRVAIIGRGAVGAAGSRRKPLIKRRVLLRQNPPFLLAEDRPGWGKLWLMRRFECALGEAPRAMECVTCVA